MQYTRKAVLRGTIVAGGFLVGTAILTGLLPNPVFDRHLPRSGTDALFLLSTTLLLGGYTTQRFTRVDCSGSLLAYLGGAGGYFAVACPYYLPVIGGTVSKPVITAYLVPVRPVVGFASAAVLIGLITVRQRQLVTEGPAVSEVELRCPVCGTLLKDATNKPDPAFIDGRMQMKMECLDCDTPLEILVEAVPADGIDIRKRVTLRDDSSDRQPLPPPYSLAPSNRSEEET